MQLPESGHPVTLRAPVPEFAFSVHDGAGQPVLLIATNGDIVHQGRRVESDDELRAACKAILAAVFPGAVAP